MKKTKIFLSMLLCSCLINTDTESMQLRMKKELKTSFSQTTDKTPEGEISLVNDVENRRLEVTWNGQKWSAIYELESFTTAPGYHYIYETNTPSSGFFVRDLNNGRHCTVFRLQNREICFYQDGWTSIEANGVDDNAPDTDFAYKSINYQGKSLRVYPLRSSIFLSKVSSSDASVEFFSVYTEIDEFEGGSLICSNSTQIKKINASAVRISDFFVGESITGCFVDIAPTSTVLVKTIQADLLKLGCFPKNRDIKINANRLKLNIIEELMNQSGVRIDKDEKGNDRALLPCSGEKGIVPISCPSIILNEIFGYGTLLYLEDSRPHSFLSLNTDALLMSFPELHGTLWIGEHISPESITNAFLDISDAEIYEKVLYVPAGIKVIYKP